IQEADQPNDPAAALAAVTLKGRVLQRIEPIKLKYQEFLRNHPTNAPGFLAYGSFLNDLGEEEGAIENWEKARRLDPSNPAAWNNLANTYAHVGPVEKSFPLYEEAIRLNPHEPVYLHNFGTLVFLFRRDATNYFKCDEQAVFQKAFQLYQEAIAQDPNNFQLAADVAQTYYGWNLPVRATDTNSAALQTEASLATTALKAWTNALSLAPTDLEREGVQLHFARWNIRVGRFEDARTNLAGVTNVAHAGLKERLQRTLAERERAAQTASPSSPAN
ncbi:MAG TPA: tetratricopeptide repeat protein, partial [Verrucomicrobiota bacterium]|nr:tetratricopeptide repeat protein [Verrucomicrobiota bacterium]